MAPDGVVEAVDASADRGGRLGPAPKDGAPYEIGFQSLEEGLGHGIIKAVPLGRHRDAVSTQFGLLVQGAVLVWRQRQPKRATTQICLARQSKWCVGQSKTTKTCIIKIVR
ncbi:hypothetical protein Sa4125_02860 [Aureimonas sp. SA4125]|nr:hypothetical protein Sa4125_02860 [Aureimonas sp. SA4125]